MRATVITRAPSYAESCDQQLSAATNREVSLLLPLYLSSFAALFHRLGSLMRSAVLLYGRLFVAVIICEAIAGASLKRYLSRPVFNDLVYSLFYRGGLYALFVYDPFFRALRPRLAVFDLHLITRLPAYLAIPFYFLALDLVGYWIHRLQHTRFFWPFHSVHHSQHNLTFLTFGRFHLVDQFMANVVVFIPLLLLGAAPRLWFWFGFLEWFLQAIQHSELNWRLGPFYYVLAGPVFHSIHHSPQPSVLNKNFSMAFSFWDFLFGTAVDAPERCRVYGVTDLRMPETLAGQFATPFRMLYHDLRTLRAAPGFGAPRSADPRSGAANVGRSRRHALGSLRLESESRAGYRLRQ